MNKISVVSRAQRLFACGLVGLMWILTAGCADLLPKPAPQPSYYSIDGIGNTARTQPVAASAAPTLVVSPPRAAAGYDSARMLYSRTAHQLEYFAHNEWIDTPARMLAPLIVSAVENRNAFRAVIPTPSAATGDIRLDTEILRLQQHFGGGRSHVRFTLRAYVVDNATRRVLASREFDEIVPAASEDPYGGVLAANRAVQNVLTALAGMCAEAVAGWQPPEK